MREYVVLFFKGLVVALPSIIAALGIVVNNLRSSSRQRRDRTAKYKLDLIEQTYARFDELSNQFIEFRASFRKNLISFQEEIVNNGADTGVSKYCASLEELYKKIVFWATYKKAVMTEVGLMQDIDSVATFMLEDLKKAKYYAEAFAHAMKIIVVEFYETGNLNKSFEDLYEELQNEIDRLLGQEENSYPTFRNMIDSKEEVKLKEFSNVCWKLNETEKRELLAIGDYVVDLYAKDIEKNNVSKLDTLEERITEVVWEVLKA